jgi:hypothetical protein
MPLEKLKKWVVDTRARDPQRVKRVVAELRQEFDDVRGKRVESEYLRALSLLKANLPADLWKANFGDLDALPPDLVVTRISMSPPGALAGEPITFGAKIENRGRGASPPFSVNLNIDRRPQGRQTVRGLAPGDSTVVEFKAWKATLGAHSVQTISDAERKITESDERNNYLDRRFEVTGRSPERPEAPRDR